LAFIGDAAATVCLVFGLGVACLLAAGETVATTTGVLTGAGAFAAGAAVATEERGAATSVLLTAGLADGETLATATFRGAWAGTARLGFDGRFTTATCCGAGIDAGELDCGEVLATATEGAGARFEFTAGRWSASFDTGLATACTGLGARLGATMMGGWRAAVVTGAGSRRAGITIAAGAAGGDA
jgi:hypothetical protein